MQKNILFGTSPDGSDSDILSDNNNCKNSEDNDLELKIYENNDSNDKRKNKIFEDSSINDVSSYNENIKNRSMIGLNTTSTFNKRKISNFSFVSYASNDSNSIGNNNSSLYINYFFQPDENLLRNSKKQLPLNLY